MSFKAKLTDTLVLPLKKGEYRTCCSDWFVFTKNRIQVPKGSYVLNPYSSDTSTVFDKSKYELIALEKDDPSYTRNSPYQAKFDNGFVANLEMDWWQR